MAQLLLLNGPNLNLLGTREPTIYGYTGLADIERHLRQQAQALGHSLDCLQSNHEGELIDRIHQARNDGTAFILINAGAFTHTSIAIRDALGGAEVPFIELHLSNVHARESFRHHSYLADKAVGVICGFGPHSYDLALQAAHQQLSS